MTWGPQHPEICHTPGAHSEISHTLGALLCSFPRRNNSAGYEQVPLGNLGAGNLPSYEPLVSAFCHCDKIAETTSSERGEDCLVSDLSISGRGPAGLLFRGPGGEVHRGKEEQSHLTCYWHKRGKEL